MPSFTTRLGDLIESGFDVWKTDRGEAFPIFDEDYREPLQTKITDHYWMYEIGLETDAMFRFALHRRLREVMPMYNQLYLSQKMMFDPLSTIDLNELIKNSGTTSNNGTNSVTETDSRKGSDSQNATSSTDVTNSSDSVSRSVNSEFPQVRLGGDEDYATNAADAHSKSSGRADTDIKSNSSGNSTSEGTSSAKGATSDNGTHTGNMERSLKGRHGISGAALLMEYRETFLNIDLQVIGDLKNLFMGVWNTGESYSQPQFGGINAYYGWGIWPR